MGNSGDFWGILGILGKIIKKKLNYVKLITNLKSIFKWLIRYLY